MADVPESLPARFGRFLLLDRLAAGGMGEIYLAKLRGPGGFEKLLVIKRVLAEMSDRTDFVDMFLSEARVAAKLSHRNIAQIFEMGRTEERYYIAMEYVLGRSLSELNRRMRLGQTRLPIGHAVDVVMQICDGLAYAHAATDAQGPLNLIHRDISPRNLLLSYSGEVKIIDFGIAKSRMSLQPTAAGVVKGKLGYMSPEQSAARRIDRRSDIFALGVVLYELTSLVHPFLHEDPILTFDAIQRRTPEPLSRIDPLLAPLDPIVSRALAKEPAERYPDCETMRRDLQRVLHSGAIPLPPTSLADFVRDIFAEELAQDLALTQRASLASVSVPSITPLVPELPAAPPPAARPLMPVRPRALVTAVIIALAASPAAAGLHALGARHATARPIESPVTVAAVTPPPPEAVPAPAPAADPPPPPSPVPPSPPPEPPPEPPPAAEPPPSERTVAKTPTPAESPRRAVGVLEIITVPAVRIGRTGRRGSARLPLSAASGQLWLGTGTDPESDPFRVRLNYRVDGNGVAYAINAEPFAIAQNQIGAGLGRTPLTISSTRDPVSVTLIHPVDKRRLQLTVRFSR